MFKQTLRQAARQGYGVKGVRPRGALHGDYAAAIEDRLMADGDQLRLLPAA